MHKVAITLILGKDKEPCKNNTITLVVSAPIYSLLVTFHQLKQVNDKSDSIGWVAFPSHREALWLLWQWVGIYNPLTKRGKHLYHNQNKL